MVDDLLKLTIELTIGFIGLIISVRIIGRRQMQQVTPFDFVSAVVLGEIVGNTLYTEDQKWHLMIFGIFIWTLLGYIIEKASVYSKRVRGIISGTPSIIINNGMIDFKVMKEEKIDFDELNSLLRQKDVFSIQEVKYAFIETSGALTVLKKTEHEQVKRSDLELSHIKNRLTLAVIYDGEIIKQNLSLLNISEAWVEKQLKQKGINSIKDVLYAEYDQDVFYYQKYKKESESSSLT